jgi:hypothetical protein
VSGVPHTQPAGSPHRKGWVSRPRRHNAPLARLDVRSRVQLDLDPHPDATCVIGAGQRKRELGFATPARPLAAGAPDGRRSALGTQAQLT